VDARQVELPMYKAVMAEIGKPIVFNICMLGALIKITGLVKPESIMTILEKRIPAGFVDMNRKALELGMELAADFAT
jgi:2-oxoglutarate ferredoxin oxidoreductase subunit gamma